MEVVKKAHQTVADMHQSGKSTEEIEANRRREFRDKVLCSNDVGEYLLRICEYVERAEVRYDQVIEDAAKNDSAKLDKQHARRITTFLRERVAVLENPRSIGEAWVSCCLVLCFSFSRLIEN